MHCHDLLANLQNEGSRLCHAEGLEGCKNPPPKEVAAEIEKALQVLLE